MALQSSGKISSNDIQDEFGGSAPIRTSEYYSADTGVPSSGPIRYSDFYGKSSNTAPNAVISIASNENYRVGVDVRNSSDAEDGTPPSYVINWGDGTSNTYTSGSIYYHTYTNSTARTITLTVTDSAGATDSAQVTVTPAAPIGESYTVVSQNSGYNSYMRGYAENYYGSMSPNTYRGYYVHAISRTNNNRFVVSIDGQQSKNFFSSIVVGSSTEFFTSNTSIFERVNQGGYSYTKWFWDGASSILPPGTHNVTIKF